MREKLEYGAVKLLLSLAAVIPESLLYALMKYVTLAFFHLDSKRRRLTIQNLSMAFPEKSDEEIKALARETYLSLAQTVAEILLMFVDRFDIEDAVINAKEAKTRLQEIAQESPNGIIVVTAHFSNWELAAHFLASGGLPMLAVGREGNNKLIDKYITVPFREKYGNQATTKHKAMLAMAKRLKNAQAVGLLIDQKAGSLNSVKVDFFGEPAETTTSVAMLKQKFDATVVPIFIIRESRGKYRMQIGASIDYTAEEIDDPDEKIRAMTQQYTEAIEAVVRAHPEQWFWMHNRWRR
ncbi:MAG: lysophospholipid acyltransferase family protein [Sulfurovum sp.]|nr:lysophospholipid acyltransferase family protein [Sulfurovum sp.]